VFAQGGRRDRLARGSRAAGGRPPAAPPGST
jgi:hypothetical protein